MIDFFRPDRKFANLHASALLMTVQPLSLLHA
jgi:hypothetical protein